AFVGNTQGHGVYVYDPGSSLAVKVLGESGDGMLDPNETYIDANHNGKFDPGEQDIGAVTKIDDDAHIGINFVGGSGGGLYEVSFMGESQDGQGHRAHGLQTAEFAFNPSAKTAAGRFTFLGYNQVVNIGEIIPGLGTVNAIKSYDEINTSGQLAFW